MPVYIYMHGINPTKGFMNLVVSLYSSGLANTHTQMYNIQYDILEYHGIKLRTTLTYTYVMYMYVPRPIDLYHMQH